MENVLLEFDEIRKRFFGVEVLHGITLSLHHGETLGLVGENGAGKSTLMNILGGNQRPSQGSMRIAGEAYVPESPHDAAAAGIAFIHQELNLFPNLTVAENLFLTRMPRSAGLFVSRRALRQRAEALLAQVGLEVSPKTMVDRLSPGERQLVEIAKAIGSEARLIIFDEPTTSLTARESRLLFDLIRRLQDEGVAMIYISHILTEIMEHCHRVAVLRDGSLVGEGAVEEFTTASMIRLMVGRDLDAYFPPRAPDPTGAVVLEVEGLRQPGMVKDIDFQLRRGEILGVSGLMGSGRTELARLLFGLEHPAFGCVRLNGRDITRRSTRERIGMGMAFLTEDRREEGLMADASIGENMALVTLPSVAGRLAARIDAAALRRRLEAIREKVRLQASVSLEQPVKSLSGGNQQKAVLAKWLLSDPRVLILDEPTRGIDVGAKYEIYVLIQSLAAAGTGVLLISSEIEELMGLCHQILVMREGEISDRIPHAAFDQERILRASLAAHLSP